MTFMSVALWPLCSASQKAGVPPSVSLSRLKTPQITLSYFDCLVSWLLSANGLLLELFRLLQHRL
jgi:hypothetical protein